MVGPGSRLGRYRVLREIGRGGLSLVFLARDEELDRPVALKKPLIAREKGPGFSERRPDVDH